MPPGCSAPTCNANIYKLVLLCNNNMVNYNWTTSDGHRVTEDRPMNLGIAISYSPCMPDGEFRNAYLWPASENRIGYGQVGGDMLTSLTNQQLKFNYFSKDVLRQLLEERVAIRDKNRSSILGAITAVSGEAYGASLIRTPDSQRQRQTLEKTKMDLERQLREEDVTLWRDSLELRRELILADKAYAGTQFRQGLMSSIPPLNDNKGQPDTSISG